jgi:hypothetical protein
MFARIRLSKSTVACAIVVLLTACGGSEGPTQVGNGGGGVVTPPVPAVSIKGVIPSNGSQFTSDSANYPMSRVSFAADIAVTGTSNSASVSYTLDGNLLQDNLNNLVAPGLHTACVTATVVGAQTPAHVCWDFGVSKPKFVGRIIMLNGALCPTGVSVAFGPIGAQDTGTIGSDCSYVVESKYVLEQGPVLRLISGSSTTEGSAELVPKEQFGSQVSIAIPNSWTISGTLYAGQTNPVSLEECYKPNSFDQQSMCERDLRTDGSYQYQIGDYASQVPTAFCQNLSDRTIPLGDSVSFWASAAVFHQSYVNRVVFVASNPTSVCAASSTKGVQLYLHAFPTAERGSVPDANGGGFEFRDFQFGTFNGYSQFVSINCFEDIACIYHELMHLLGFGHHDGFSGVLATGDLYRPIPSPKEVMYSQLMMGVADAERQYNTRSSIPSAHQWERIMKRLPMEKVHLAPPSTN